MARLIDVLDKVATTLEKSGRKDLALMIDQVSDSVENKSTREASDEGVEKYAYDESVSLDESLKDFDPQSKEAAQKIIDEDVQMIKTALEECDAADREIEAAMKTLLAAKKRKKKWIKGIKLRKGRLTKYKKPGESMEEAAKRSLRSDDPSVRGMGSFWMAARKFKKKGKKGKKGKKDSE